MTLSSWDSEGLRAQWVFRFTKDFFHNLDSFLQKKKKKSFCLSITSLPPKCLIQSSLKLVERVRKAASNLKWNSVPSITDKSSAHTELPNGVLNVLFFWQNFALYPLLPAFPHTLWICFPLCPFFSLPHAAFVRFCYVDSVFCYHISMWTANHKLSKNNFYFPELQLVQEQARVIWLIPPS